MQDQLNESQFITNQQTTQSDKIEEHNHDGVNSQKILGVGYPRQAVDTAPTDEPLTAEDQIVLYINGTTYRLYTYINGDWYYVNLTLS